MARNNKQKKNNTTTTTTTNAKKNVAAAKKQQQQQPQMTKKQQQQKAAVAAAIMKSMEEEELMGADDLDRELMNASSDDEADNYDNYDSDELPDSYEGEKTINTKKNTSNNNKKNTNNNKTNNNNSKNKAQNNKNKKRDHESDDDDSEAEEEQPQRKKQKTAPQKQPKKRMQLPVEEDSEDDDEDDEMPAMAKNTMFDSDSDDDQEVEDSDEDGKSAKDFFGFADSSDEDEEDDEYLSKIEKDAANLDAEQEKVLRESEAELRDAALEQERVNLMEQYEQEEEEAGEDDELNIHGFGEDITKIHTRIMENIRVLSNFSEFREEGYTRADYLRLLGSDLSSYYGYSPEIIEMFLGMFSVPEVVQLLEANEAPRPITIRSNQLKTRRRELAQNLINRGINLDPIDKWTKVGLKIIDAKVPLGATPEYLSGHYMLQGASSFLPVMALNPKQGEKILDMAAAPGGKTTYIGECMKNTGVLFANDFSKERSHALVANIHRMGVRNAIIFNYDGRDLPQILPEMMDRVLLDAPCTGLGVVSRDPSIKLNKTKEDFTMCSKLQKELILAAIDCVDANSATGGFIVYSTCSISVEENEEVVAYALKKRHVQIVDSGLPFGNDGFTKVHGKTFCPQMSMSKRFYPHAHNMDGFFVCKLQKLKNGPKEKNVKAEKALEKKKKQEVEKKREQKAKNIEEQKKRETKNKQLLQEALKQTGGNLEAAKQLMEDRKKEILATRKKFRTTQRKDKWRPIGRFAKQSGGQNMV